MKFLLMMYNDEAAWNRLSKAEQDAAVQELFAFDEVLKQAGKVVISHGLVPSNEAVSIRRRKDGGRIVTDGPFAESKEVTGGYYVIECDSREEAVEWGKKGPLTTWGVEVRRIHIE